MSNSSTYRYAECSLLSGRPVNNHQGPRSSVQALQTCYTYEHTALVAAHLISNTNLPFVQI